MVLGKGAQIYTLGV